MIWLTGFVSVDLRLLWPVYNVRNKQDVKNDINVFIASTHHIQHSNIWVQAVTRHITRQMTIGKVSHLHTSVVYKVGLGIDATRDCLCSAGTIHFYIHSHHTLYQRVDCRQWSLSDKVTIHIYIHITLYQRVDCQQWSLSDKVHRQVVLAQCYSRSVQLQPGKLYCSSG